MPHDLQTELARFDANLPLEQAATIPSSWYTNPILHEAEQRAVFGATWQVVGRSEQVARPGSFLTAQIADAPILVVRDHQGHLRAFHNVCRHRGAPLLTAPCGEVTKLRCRYHGWTYDLSGHLRGIPEFEGVTNFQRDDHGLVPVAVAIWGPLVWVNLAGIHLTLEEFLAPLPQRCRPQELEALHFVERREYELDCNWKVFVDNYLDGGYHVNTVHPGLAGVLDYSQYRTELGSHTCVQISPLRPAETGRTDVVAQVRQGAMAYYWWIFPNFMINLYQDVMDTNLVIPLGPEKCRVLFDFYFASLRGAEAERFIAQSIAVADQIQQEDQTICAEVQRGLRSRSFESGRFSVKREAGGYHFHQLLAGALQTLKD